jgi:hypothetical protein
LVTLLGGRLGREAFLEQGERLLAQVVDDVRRPATVVYSLAAAVFMNLDIASLVLRLE